MDHEQQIISNYVHKLSLAFQCILNHLNQSSNENVMIKIQTARQHIHLHTGYMEIYTTHMLHI
jgi:hypothetical protein